MFKYRFKAILAKSVLVTQVGCFDSDSSIRSPLRYREVFCVSGGRCVLRAARRCGSAGCKTGCKADSV